MTRRRLVRPTGLLAEHAAMETERDDALLRAEQAETREAELEAELAELRKYVAGVKNAHTTRQAAAFDEAVEALAWALNNGPTTEGALAYVRDHNPYRAEPETTP